MFGRLSGVKPKKGSSLSKTATQGDKLQNQVVAFLVKGLGMGMIPWMPGTWGSLLGLFLVYFLGIHVISVTSQVVFATILTIASLWLIHIYEKNTKKHDDSQVVIDEIVGIYICFLGVPLTPASLIVGFVAFRILDILKPFPIFWVDRKVPGAVGTLFDDVLAGLAGCLVVHFILSQGWI